MTIGTEGNDGPESGADAHVREVVRSAEQELHQLLRQRAEIMKRIGTLKQTLTGLANIFGEWLLDEELSILLDRKTASPRSGFTRACRQTLMNSPVALSARQICEQLQKDCPELRDRHKNLHASVTTVLNRLVEYAEVRTFPRADGRRVWQWIAEAEIPARDAALRADETAISPDREVVKGLNFV